MITSYCDSTQNIYCHSNSVGVNEITDYTIFNTPQFNNTPIDLKIDLAVSSKCVIFVYKKEYK